MRVSLVMGCRLLAAALALTVATQTPAWAQPGSAADFSQIAASQAAANSKSGPRVSPARTLSVPTADVSPEMQASIAAPYAPIFAARPKSSAEWKAFVTQVDGERLKLLPAVRAALGVFARMRFFSATWLARCCVVLKPTFRRLKTWACLKSSKSWR